MQRICCSNISSILKDPVDFSKSSFFQKEKSKLCKIPLGKNGK